MRRPTLLANILIAECWAIKWSAALEYHKWVFLLGNFYEKGVLDLGGTPLPLYNKIRKVVFEGLPICFGLLPRGGVGGQQKW